MGHSSTSAKEQASRIEQRTLVLSIYGVLVVAAGSIAYGLFLESDVVILNGIFSLLRRCCFFWRSPPAGPGRATPTR